MTSLEPESARRFYSFGSFLVDPVRRLLWREGQLVPLTSRAFDVLLLLIERRHEVLDKHDLLAALWGTTVVEEATVVRHISTLRKALHVRPDEHDILVTIPGRGYQFVAPLEELQALPPLEPARPGPGEPVEDQRGAEDPPADRRDVPGRRSLTSVRVVMFTGAAAAVVIALLWWSTRPDAPGGPPRGSQLHPVTFDAGLPRNPAWAPDGRTLAYSSDRAGNPDIWVQSLDDPNAHRLTSWPEADWQPDWSPDGHWIAFRSERDGGGLYLVPARGGEPRRLTTFGYSPRWSPDGRTILFSSTPLRTGELPRLYVTDRENGAVRAVRPELTLEFRSLSTAWHPDGRVSLWGQRRTGGWAFITVPLVDGPAVLSSGMDEVAAAIEAEGLTLRRFVWSPRGDALYFEGSSESVRNIWRVPVDARSLTWKSAPERLTTSATSETEIAVSPDGRRLAFRAHAERTRLWSFPLEAGGLRAAAGEPLTSGEGRELQPDAPTAGNKLLYQTVRGAHRELREISLIDRREHVLLAGTERIDRALWSSDGTRLAYLRRLDDLGAAPAEFVVLRPSGGVEARYALSRDSTTRFRPSDWSPDGTWILGGCRPNGSTRLAVCSLDVGEPSPAVAVITAHPDLNLFQQRLSPDGGWITFMAANPLEAGTSTIHVVPAGGGAWTPITDGRQFDDKPIWSADGRRLYYLSNRGGFFNVWGRRFDPAAGQPVGSPFRVTDFHSPRLMISPDNIPSVGIAVAAEQLVLPITEASGQLWVLDLPAP